MFSGGFETFSESNTDLNKGSMFRIDDDDLQLYWKNRNASEFYKMLRLLKTGRTLTQPRFDYGQTDKSANYVIVKKDAAFDATSIDVFDAYTCVAGDRLFNPRTNELVRIDAVDDSDTISTAATTGYGRGFAGSTGAIMRAGDYLFKTGRLIAEKGVAPDSNSVAPKSDYNYCEFWVKAMERTNMQEATKMLDGVGQVSEQYMRKIWEMDEEINFALYWGKRYRTYEAEGALYAMNGIAQQIKTHAINGAGIAFPTWELYNEWFSPTFDANSSSTSKVLFAGKNLRTSVLSAARAVGIAPTQYLTKLGSTVTQIDVDGGTIDIMGDYKSFQGPLSGSGFLVDSAHVEFRPFNTFDRKLMSNIELPNQIMIEKDCVVQAGSVALQHEEAHARLDGFNGPFNGLKSG